MSAAAAYGDIVIRLRDEYIEGVNYGEKFCSMHTTNRIVNTGFMGSLNVVFLSSEGSIIHAAPACIAAPLVTMVAKKALRLGMVGIGDPSVPVRLYVPQQLSITARHLTVGEVKMVVVPKHGFVSCKKLTFLQSTEEAPPCFETVRSWVVNDDAEVEIIHQ